MIASMAPKTKRLSTVAVTGAVLAVVWAIADSWLNIDSVVVSSVTALAMLVAGFYDFKYDDADTFPGEGGSE